MDAIQMVDLKKQYQHIKEEVLAAFGEVLDTAAFINGKWVQNFSAQLATYLGAKHVIPCANGTDALQISMMALGLQPGDEIITPSFTYIATVEVMALLRLTPVFVEVDPKTFCVDPAVIEAAITSKTKAIVPVHLYGHSAYMEAIMAIAAKHNLFVIEDNAQAIGGDYIFSDGTQQKNGTIGTIGCTSFFPSKNLGCYGDGGAMYTNDDDLAIKLRMIANHGQSRRYYHDMVGCNSRLDTLQAAVLGTKLKHLDTYASARQRVADYYDRAFGNQANITTPYRAGYTNHVFHQYTLIIEAGENSAANRNALQQHLADAGIPSMIYYPVPSHRQKMFASIGSANISLPVTDWLTNRVISLPIHTEMDEDQLQFITDNVLAYFK